MCSATRDGHHHAGCGGCLFSPTGYDELGAARTQPLRCRETETSVGSSDDDGAADKVSQLWLSAAWARREVGW